MTARNVTRRSFLKGTAAAGVAAGLAGTGAALAAEGSAEAETEAAETAEVDYVAALGDGMRGMPVADREWACFSTSDSPIGYEQREIAADEITETLSCDVLVIGGGVAGIMAATEAANEGADVICIEKMTTGRNQWESVGGYNTFAQKEKGLEVDPAVYANEITKAAGYRVRQENVWSFINNSGAAVDFMEEVLERSSSGIVIDCKEQDETPYGWTIVQAEHTFLNTGATTWLLGPFVMDALNEAVTTYDNIDMRFETAGVQLVQGADGRVTGAIAKSMADGTYLQIDAAKGVVLATGGYEMNPEMVKAWCRPEDVCTTSMSSFGTGSTGDGHMMGLAAGAGMDPLPHCMAAFGGGYPENGQFFHSFRRAIYVNSRGERFVNEALMYNFVASAINTNAFRGGVWTIFDQSYVDALSESSGNDMMETVQSYADAGYLQQADTLAELAEKIGVDADRLQGTVETWNAYFDADEPKDEQFMRVLDECQKFDTAPYYAMATNSSFLVTVSGLSIDPDSRVLDKNEQVIPGLFAAGNTSGGMFADQYPRHLPSTSVGRAVTTGYVAGRTAAAQE